MGEPLSINIDRLPLGVSDVGATRLVWTGNATAAEILEVVPLDRQERFTVDIEGELCPTSCVTNFVRIRERERQRENERGRE